MTSEATQRNKVGRPRKDPNAPPKPKGIPHELAHFDELPDSAHVREPVVRGLLGGVSNSTVWRAVREGKLPAPVKLLSNVTAWKVDELRKALAHYAGGSVSGHGGAA
jgi:predicted DNA-binding transcriptional regulator AlpA